VETGTLGPDVEVYSWNNSNSAAENVQFVNNLLFDLVIPDDYPQGGGALFVPSPLDPWFTAARNELGYWDLIVVSQSAADSIAVYREGCFFA
jgi:hypothetical protein